VFAIANGSTRGLYIVSGRELEMDRSSTPRQRRGTGHEFVHPHHARNQHNPETVSKKNIEMPTRLERIRSSNQGHKMDEEKSLDENIYEARLELLDFDLLAAPHTQSEKLKRALYRRVLVNSIAEMLAERSARTAFKPDPAIPNVVPIRRRSST
jgi:hypothetical protein